MEYIKLCRRRFLGGIEFDTTPSTVTVRVKPVSSSPIPNSTKHDIASSYRVPLENIRVVVPGVADCFYPRQPSNKLQSLKTRLGLGDVPYLLFVGKLSHRRHVPDLLRAFDLLKLKHKIPHRLSIVGPNPLGWDIAGAIAACQSHEDIRYAPHLDWDALALLYAGADLFVLPTEHEGLSFTILEAMASGTPVVTLDHAALEAGMRDAVAFSPSSDSAAARGDYSTDA